MLLICFSFGLFGILGMTWLFPLAARIVRCADGADPAAAGSRRSECSRIAVLLPAHNESGVLEGTLESINAAAACLQRSFPEVAVDLWVCADGCTDQTAAAARSRGASVVETDRRGKWRAINLLVAKAAGADWVVLADSGIVWTEELLLRAWPQLTQQGCVGFAPTYANPSGGRLERTLWRVERHFKTLEAKAGGPVAVHGATMFYRRPELCQVLERLRAGNWLNDDVVLPLYLRSLFPHDSLCYSGELAVWDRGAKPGREFGRRRRMVIGNVQWIRLLLPLIVKSDLSVALLSLRRVFRVFWAYWGLLLLLSMLLLLSHVFSPPLLWAAVILAAGLGWSIQPLRGLFDSGCASLLAPVYFFNAARYGETDWQ